MMQGWTLLSQHCPRCTTVLVGHKTHGVECVSCEMPCVTEEQAEQMKVLSTANGHVADVPGKDVADMDDYDEEDGGWTPPSPEEMRRIEALSAERDRISQRMGPKLLSGWIMLNAHCRSCVSSYAYPIVAVCLPNYLFAGHGDSFATKPRPEDVLRRM